MQALEYPPIEAAAAPVPAPLIVSLKSAALTHFTAIEPNIRALAEKYRAVAYDVATTKGMDAAKKARLDLRENGRYAVQRAEKAVKDEVNDLKRVIATKVESLIAIVQPVEDHVHGQITAQEEKLAAEKAERERVEAERKQGHEDRIAMLRGYVAKAAGLSSARIANGILAVEAIVIDPAAWEEYAERAEIAKIATLTELLRMRDTAKAAEDAAAAAEAQRIEQARVAAEQAAEAKRLADAAAELQRQQRAEAERLEAERAEIARQRAELETLRNPPPAEPEPAPAVDPVAPPVAVERPVITVQLDDAPPVEIPAPMPLPTLKLGAISTRFGFTVTADFLRSLGFEPAGRERAAVIYHEGDFAGICRALRAHIERVESEHAPA